MSRGNKNDCEPSTDPGRCGEMLDLMVVLARIEWVSCFEFVTIGVSVLLVLVGFCVIALTSRVKALQNDFQSGVTKVYPKTL